MKTRFGEYGGQYVPEVLMNEVNKVAEAFEVPLDFILEARNHQLRTMLYHGQERQYYAIPYQQRHIWGATAAMLVGLARRITGNPLLP